MLRRVGLTGGIGAGKSEVGKIFAELGALVIDADALARDAVAPGTEELRRIAERWPHVVLADGSLDRPGLANLVFNDPAAREFVNGIVHPAVRARSAAIERTAQADQIVVHEVPLLFEAGFYRECDRNVLVEASREARIARVIQRSGSARTEIERRMDAQIDPAKARPLADHVIQNNGTLADLRGQVAAVFTALQR